jgi:hypothetical protein
MFASNQTFIVAAYTVTWLVFIGYSLRLAGASRRARIALGGALGDATREGRP